MPPRKLDGTPKKPKKGTPRSRANKDKPVLKTPKIFTLKIPKQILPRTSTENLNIVNIVKTNEDQQQLPITSKDNENRPVLEIEKVKKAVTKKKPALKRKRLEKNIPDGTTVKVEVVKPVRKRCAKDKTQINIENRNTKKGSVEEYQNTFNVCELNRNYIKLMMANEVISLQFSKSSKLEKLQKTEKLEEKKITVRKKPITNRKRKPRNNVANGEATETADEPPKRKSIRRRNIRKIADSPNELEVKPIITAKEESKGNENIKSKSSFQPVRRNKRLLLKHNTPKAGPVLQNNLNSVIKEDISVPLLNNNIEQSNLMMDTNDDVIVKDISFAKCQSDEKRSVASSDQSWTRDISSSSATSLITVGNENIVLFDNKLPILQLTSIDGQLKKNKKHLSVIDNYHESKSSQNVSENRIMFETSNETGIPNGCIIESRSNNVNETDTPHLSVDHNTSSSSDSSSGSSSNTSSNTATLRVTTTPSNNSSISRSNNILQKTENSAQNKDSVKDSLFRPSITCISTSDADLKLSETSAFSNDTSNINTTIQELALNIKKFCLNKLKMPKPATKPINNVNNSHAKKVIDQIFTEEIFSHEKNVIELGLSVIRLAANDLKQADTQEVVNNYQEISYNSISNPTQTLYDRDNISTNDECVNQINECPKQNIEKAQDDLHGSHEKCVYGSTTGDKLNKDASSNKMYQTFVDHDDDDALSLFAESISGMESCRNSSMSELKMPESEQNPRPSFKNIQPINYRPAKISYENNVDKNQNHTIVNTENDVSSSPVLDESRNKSVTQENNLIYGDRVGKFPENSAQISNSINTNQMLETACLMGTIYRPPARIRSYVFTGVCYFFQRSKCKNPVCIYPHINIPENEVQNKLSKLNEKTFVYEYMRLRRWSKLRHLYGLVFVKECIRRNLTRILVEMGIDFLSHSYDSIPNETIKSDIIDYILMYLNDIDLATCEDLLRYNSILPGGSVLLCDIFMSIIAKSQNFSRFKPIFIKLSQFMHGIGRKFNVNITELILERICILPYDEMLARSVLLITRNTDASIFLNAHIVDLEKQLQTFNNELYEELKSLKELALLRLPTNAGCSIQSPGLNNVLDIFRTNSPQTEKNTTRSPDSPVSPDVAEANTNFEITFTKNINLDKFKLNRSPNEAAKTNSVDNVFSLRNSSNPWRHRSIFDHLRLKDQARIPPRPHMRMPFKRPRTNQSYEGSPSKFHRKSGPNNY